MRHPIIDMVWTNRKQMMGIIQWNDEDEKEISQPHWLNYVMQTQTQGFRTQLYGVWVTTHDPRAPKFGRCLSYFGRPSLHTFEGDSGLGDPWDPWGRYLMSCTEFTWPRRWRCATLKSKIGPKHSIRWSAFSKGFAGPFWSSMLILWSVHAGFSPFIHEACARISRCVRATPPCWLWGPERPQDPWPIHIHSPIPFLCFYDVFPSGKLT